MLPEYDFQVLKLTQEFYNKYTNPPYVEIETKEIVDTIVYSFRPIMIILSAFRLGFE